MSRTRRTLTVLALMTGLLTVSLPASASFQDTATVQTAVTAGTVTAPSSLSVTGCRYQQATGSYWNGYRWVTTYTEMYRATLSWSAGSAPRGVTGYLVTVYSGTQSVMMMDSAVSPRTMTQEMPSSQVPAGLTLTVTTRTGYGWTAESAARTVPAPWQVPTC